ncbi:hypothetical protein BDP55DRAFT_550976 [Colletotrichum godetiae]|uniref:Transcription factor domain-containing protein n=1 Tax=Colletotrichum godetiae TaxID=1209918 RepID=A0AAJ0ALU2_9PEZI|nr:uncharacterized protein BDP55DRAFT_550976 [Colletotrichum godetiae]KAK1676278.1 hypothetical protein BDP55DRAFT_550976 [Colletotrichum godetiae]
MDSTGARLAEKAGTCLVHSHRLGNDLNTPEDASSLEETSLRQRNWYDRHRRKLRRLEISDNQRRYLEDEGAFLELPKSTTDILLPIYNMLLDDLIPVVDGAVIFRNYSNGQASVFLIRAISLVACKFRQAAPFLRIHEDDTIMDQREFASRLLKGLDASIKADLEPDRITKVQILALVHLHNDGLSGLDRSSGYLSQAISEAWAISLHVKVPVNSEQERCDFLWWTLRSFDRLNKPVMGAAPFMIDDTDVGIERIAPRKNHYRSQLMAISLSLGDLMKSATRVYKASSTTTDDDCNAFPTFSELTTDICLDGFQRSHRLYLQIWYHVAAMLSCRYSGPESVQYQRRLSSADSILRIVCLEGPENLPPLPLVPYAMSMSTTVIYRALRDGERSPEIAHKDLGACYNSLMILSQSWTSAKGVARVVRRLQQFTRPGAAPIRTADGASCTCENIRQHANVATNLVSSFNAPHRPTQSTTGSSVLPLSSLVQPSEGSQPQSPADNDDHPGNQADTGVVDGLSYSHFDRAFYDFFDYGMPSLFRDLATWDFLQIDANDGLGA